MKKCIFLYIAIFLVANTNAQQDTIKMEEFEVSANRCPSQYSESIRITQIITNEDIASFAASDINNLLEILASVDMRQRGAYGMQADVSIRGGSFDQCLILLNGMKISDSQTGHHSMNLPVSLEDIEYIEVLEGPGTMAYGANAYAGAINIVTKKTYKNNCRFQTVVGEDGLLLNHLSIGQKIKSNTFYLSGSYGMSNGYIENTDFTQQQIFYRSTHKNCLGLIEVQAAYMNKAFGANSFYTPKYPYQYENIKSEFIGLKYTKGENLKLKFSTYWRRHHDRFELFREDNDYYIKTNEYYVWDNDTAGFGGEYYYSGHNYHQTNQYNCDINISYHRKKATSIFGVEYSREGIKSNVLGDVLSTSIEVKGEDDAFFTNAFVRNNLTFYAEQNFKWSKLTLVGGYMAHYNEKYNWNYYGGLSLSYKLLKHTSLFAAFSQSMRLPTFTDLYYQGPTNMGNPNLKPEESINLEFGSKHYSKLVETQISAFRRYGYNTIDWVKENPGDKWQSYNHTDIIASGFQVNMQFSVLKLLKINSIEQQIRLSYQYLYLEKESGDLLSNYALDYLRHKISFFINQEIYKNVFISAKCSFQDRNGSYTAYENTVFTEEDYQPFALVDTRIHYAHKLKNDALSLKYFLDVHNVFDKKHFDYGNLIMPGRWITAGFSIQLTPKRKNI
jgi:vitamin B12 transporter